MSWLTNIDWSPFALTFRLAIITTSCLLVIGIPIAYVLAYSKNKFKIIPEALITMPLILPPTVLGFYLLVAFNPNSGIGLWLQNKIGIQLAFSFSGVVIGSILYSLPFMVQPIQNAFQAIPKEYIETSYLLGKSKFETLRYVLLPNIKKAIISAIILTFAHTVGEFGVVLMVGGSIPDKTKVASIAIYEQVESLNYGQANIYAFILFIFSFLTLVAVYGYNNSNVKKIFPFR